MNKKKKHILIKRTLNSLKDLSKNKMNKKTPIQLTNKIIQNYKNNKIAKKSLRIIIATIALI